ncbi:MULTISPECIES: hypothetical protein [Falsihalocynthiibacter]|uniref:hypothetical protein n=1 Tax=Falsihalocynthiibacter TaxID=2854182 RepID=UPI00300323B5
MIAESDIRPHIISLNQSFHRKHLHRFGNGVGFCSEFNDTANVLTRCLAEELQFCQEIITRPQGVSTIRGWQDYFLPFCQELSTPLQGLNTKALARRKYAAVRALTRGLLKLSTGCSSFMFDAIERGKPQEITIKSLNYSGQFNVVLAAVSRAIWKFNASTQSEVDAIREMFGFSSVDIALHIRRGDKISEFNYVPLEMYVEALEPYRSSGNSLFIATDDTTIVDEMKALLSGDFTILSAAEMNADQQKKNVGYDQTTFNDLPPKIRRANIISFLVEMEIMRTAQVLIGTSSSNVFITQRGLRDNKLTINLTKDAWNDRENWRTF